MSTLLRRILGPVPAAVSFGSTAEWWANHRGATTSSVTRIDEAITGGFLADRVAYAFAAGYQAALRVLVPDLPRDHIASLCATEEAGAHPRNIRTALTPDSSGGFVLDGNKRWATLAADASHLLVIANTGQQAGRNQLKLVRVDARARGVTFTAAPPTPFAPEIAHAEIAFVGVDVRPREVLAGDGYEDYLKPFRTIEDTHVFAAVLAYVLVNARRYQWPQAVQEDIVALLVGVHALGTEPPRDPVVHVALAGLLRLAQRTLEESAEHWSRCPDEVRAGWDRDRVLLQVASGARTQRLARAWEALHPAP